MSYLMKSPRKCRSLAPACCAALAATGLIAAPALAVDGSWVAADGAYGTASNWTSNPQVPGGGGTATFGQTFAGNRTISVNVSPTLAQVNFASSSAYVLANGGGTITLAGPTVGDDVQPAVLNSAGGGQPIFATLAGGAPVDAINVTKAGVGTIALGGNNAALYAAFDVQGGALRAVSNNGFGAADNLVVSNGGVVEVAGGLGTPNQFLGLITPLSAAPNGAVRSLSGANTWNGTWFLAPNPVVTTSVGVDTGSTLTLNGPIVEDTTTATGPASFAKVGVGTFVVTQPLTLRGVAVNAGTVRTATATASRLGTLSTGASPTAPTGRYDVATGGVAVTTADLTAVRQQIRAAYAPGNGAAAWSGNGITTGSGTSSTIGLAYGPASDFKTAFPTNFAGQQVVGTDVVISPARFGDANLDGSVGFADLNRLRVNYLGTGKRWSQADFNYDGSVGFADLNLLRFNYLASGGPAPFASGGAAVAAAAPAGEPALTGRAAAAPSAPSAAGLPARDGDVSLVVDVDSGEVRLVSPTPMALGGYEIRSASGALLAEGWASLGESGLDGWQEIAGTAGALTEEDFNAPLTLVDALGLSLGRLFDPSGPRDLSLQFADAGFSIRAGGVSYVPEPAAGAILAASGLLLARRRRRKI